MSRIAGPLPLQLDEQRVGDAAVAGGVDAVGVVEHLVVEVVELLPVIMNRRRRDRPRASTGVAR